MLLRSLFLGVLAAVGLRLLLAAAPFAPEQEPTASSDYEALYAPMVLSDLQTALEDRKDWLASLSKDLLDELESDPKSGEIVRLGEGTDLLAGPPAAALRICYGSTSDPNEARLLRIPAGDSETLDHLMEEIHWLTARIDAFTDTAPCPK